MNFDLDAVDQDAAKAPFPFTFGGEDFELPGVMDVRTIAAFEQGRLSDGLERLLGDEQWKALNAVKAPLSDTQLGALFEAYGAHLQAQGDALVKSLKAKHAGKGPKGKGAR